MIQFEEEWSKIEEHFFTIVQLVQENVLKRSDDRYMAVYSIVYNLCVLEYKPNIPRSRAFPLIANPRAEIYSRCKAMYEGYLRSVTEKVKGRNGFDLLDALLVGWQNHQAMMKWTASSFRYLDEYYTRLNSVDPLKNMMMMSFKGEVYEHIKGDLMQALLMEIDNEREGGDVDSKVLKDCINLYVEMGMGQLTVYTTDFEDPLITRTSEYYSRKAQRWLTELGIDEFLLNGGKAIAEEQRRSISYMNASTQPKLLSTVQQQLLTTYRGTVLDDPEIDTLLGSLRTNDLQRMHQLKRIEGGLEPMDEESWGRTLLRRMYRLKVIEGGLEPMAEKLKEFVEKEGHSINTSIDQKSYVEQCIDLHEKIGDVISDCMENHQIFLKARKDAFEVFINESLLLKQDEGRGGEAQKITSSELLSTYCDNLMKNKEIDPDDFEEKINVVISMFTYIQGKDLFQVQQQLLTQYRDDPELDTVRLLESWRTNDLRRVYRFYKRIESGLEPMAEKFKKIVEKEGHSINTKLCSGSIDQKGYIEQCIDLHEKFGGLISDSMGNHQIFLEALRDAFEVFMNELLPLKQDEGRSGEAKKITSSELLSTYCDGLMKHEKIEPDDLEEKIKMILSIFTYIQDKDLFQEFYRMQMSRRLLVGKTDCESERQLIGKLKVKMGAAYTSKLEGMITDKGMCEDQHNVFLEWAKQQGKALAIDFSAQVLTTGFWPAFKNDQLVLPAELNEYLELYGNYHSQKASSRVLKWINNLGTATVSAKFKNNKEYLLTVSTYQVCVLLLFNKHNEITIHQLQQELMLAVEDVKPTVQSFMTPKYPILSKSGGNKMSGDGAFTVNEEFTNPKRKIKIPTIAVKTGGGPVEKTDESRRHIIDACIVRIMKSWKIMAHNDLQAECIKQLSATFKPDPPMIKKCIENLIARQYLERDSEDRNRYHYLS